MEQEIAKTIFEKVKALPRNTQEEILEFIEDRQAMRDSRPIWEVLVEMSREIPDEMWAELPADGSINHDHYLYGAPKKKA